jgi:hypothetical protein
MRVALDTSVLLYLAFPNAPAPTDPKTGKRVTHCQERIEGLLEGLDAANTHLILPTPVLSEVLINAADRQVEILAALTNKSSVDVAGFDQMAAVENAALRRSKKLLKRGRGVSKTEVKFDLQVLAIARVTQCEMIMTDDGPLRARAVAAGFKVAGVADLPLPESKRQITLMLTAPEASPDPEQTPVPDNDDNASD